MSPFDTWPMSRCASDNRTGCETRGRNIHRSRPFMSRIWPRSDAGSRVRTTVFSLPFERTLKSLSSRWRPACAVRILTSTSNPSPGKRASSARRTMSCGDTPCWAKRGAAQNSPASALSIAKQVLRRLAIMVARTIHWRSQRMVIVRLEKVHKEYALGSHKVQALTDVSFSVEAGSLLAIAGPSGSGKSTLLNLIGQIDVPSRGKVIVAGHDISGKSPDDLAELRLRTVGFIFQTFNLFPVLTAEENVEYPLLQMQEMRK